MRRISVLLSALALAGGVALGVVALAWAVVFFVDGGEDDRVPQAQAPPPGGLPAGMGQLRIHGNQIAHPVVAARMYGRTFRYVLQDHMPARFLKGQVSVFLYDFGFGENGRPMVVRLLDDEGRFAWTAGYDGVKSMWVHARPELAGCGPIVYAKGRRLPNAPGAREAPPCPVEPFDTTVQR